MKKSLMIISFAFIFLLSMSIVSASFFDWLTGDVAKRAKDAKARVGKVQDRADRLAVKASESTGGCPRGYTQSTSIKEQCCVKSKIESTSKWICGDGGLEYESGEDCIEECTDVCIAA